MTKRLLIILIAVTSSGCFAQSASNPFSTPVNLNSEVISVNYEEFARIPFENNVAPRLMHMITEPGTQRHFVSNMAGKLYSVSYDGDTVTEYLNLAGFDVPVMAAGRERGLQSFAFHPDFARSGSPGYGRFYTFVDVREARGPADFMPTGNNRTHDTVLLEWIAQNAAAAAYDGGLPRELFRAAQPYGNHNAGETAFNPLAQPGDNDYGLLYIGMADGGSGGDPLNMAQNLSSIFGKILRIDPLGNNSANGRYGIPANNPFLTKYDALPEIYARGVRNPQRFGWDADNGRMLVADIGQNQVEEISEIRPGGNLGWNQWEGSYRHSSRRIRLDNPRSDPDMTWPLLEYDHNDPMLVGRAAVSGVMVYRGSAIPQLQDLLIFSDIPSGELLYVPADYDEGGHGSIRRIALDDNGEGKNLLQLVREENARRGDSRAQRADLRFGYGPGGELFLLNKADGIIRKLIP